MFEALLEIWIEPVTSPVAVGSNFTCRVTLWPEFSVTGKVPPDMVNADPLRVAELMVSAAVPDEVSVTACVVDDPTVTSPKDRLVLLIVRVAFSASSCSSNTLDTPLALAVRVAVSFEFTARAVAVKLAFVEPAAIVTVAGTVTLLSLLVRVTTVPPVGAAALRVTVQLSVPAPVMVPLAQVSELTAPVVESPVPLRVTVAVGLAVALLVIRMVPVSPPATVGSKVTCSVADCPGFSVTGRARPAMVKPEPLRLAPLMVSAAVPVEVSVSD